jgi:ABC-type sugar transport system, periplasmic component
MKKKVLATLLSLAMVATMLAGCSNPDAPKPEAEAPAVEEPATEEPAVEEPAAEEPAAEEPAGEEVTLRLFSNLPDRKNGQGLVEQTIVDEYMAANPNVKIEVETLDEEAYKTKFKAYAMEGMPDVVSVWGQPAFIDEVLEAGVLAELNQDDYTDYKFLPGSTDGFSKDGKLYGLPRNSDVIACYYNQKMFEDNGWAVPTTYDELIELGKTIKAAGIIPMAMDGGDGWPLCIYFSDVVNKVNGEYQNLIGEALKTGDFSDPAFKKTAELMVEAQEAGLWQNGYDSQDYGTAMNLFTNGQAAMFYMGSWETSMARNEDIPQEVRENIRAFTMPVVDGGKGGANDIAAWCGGGYAVAANSPNKDEAVKFFNFMFQPDKLSKYGWENGVGMSAQDQSEYMTGDETELQLQLLGYLNAATSMSGTPFGDMGTAAFKSVIESEIQGMTNGSTPIDQWFEVIAAPLNK